MALILMCLALVLGSAFGASEDPTVYLVRHAEKSSGPDPVLTEQGRVRAERLAVQLADAGITQIYSTDYRRTTQTAAPLAETLGIGITPYDPFDLSALSEVLRTKGETALVVGHSNTIPVLAELLSGEPQEPIEEAEYDRLYAISLGDGRLMMLVAGSH